MWGILRANEYLDSDDTLRRALVVKAEENGISHLPPNLTYKVFNKGLKLSELTKIEQGTVLVMKEGIRPRLKKTKIRNCYKKSEMFQQHLLSEKTREKKRN